MSSAANIKNSAAKVAVKVPFPDSLVEVRMSPPESNFEVKVTPGGDVIELLIRPGCSQIEVRITQPGDQGAERPLPPPADPTDPDPEPESAAKAVRESGAQPALSEAAEEEVVPGVSKAEFAAMVEEDAADEAKKLLAEIYLDSLAGAGPSPNYELPAEARKILEEDDQPEELPLKAPEAEAPGDEAGPPALEAVESSDPIMVPEEAAPPSEQETPAPEVPEVIENEARETTPAEGDEAPAESRPDDAPAAPEEMAEAPLQMELEIESLPGEIIDASPAESPEKDAAGSLEQLEIEVENFSAPIGTATASRPVPEEEWSPAPASAESDTARLELDFSSSLIMEGDLGADSTAAIPEAVEEAARQALARLSAATYEERGGLELERPSVELPEPPAAEAASLPDQAVDRTIMVEYIEDTEAGPQHLPDDTVTPLPEEDQMDLGPVEMEDEELAIDPIDLGDVDLDLEKSRTGNSADSQTVKAKPMVTALPNNTIVPQ